MIPNRMCIAAAALLVLGVTHRAEAQISVIVAPGQTQTLSAEQAAEIFAGGTVTWPNGQKVQIVESGDAVLVQLFYAKLVKKPTSVVRAQWTKLALSGQALAPQKGVTAAEVKALVARTPGAIGYVRSADVDATVKEAVKVP
jgi:ABC-type phosphate transport system substrate-binding protein